MGGRAKAHIRPGVAPDERRAGKSRAGDPSQPPVPGPGGSVGCVPARPLWRRDGAQLSGPGSALAGSLYPADRPHPGASGVLARAQSDAADPFGLRRRRLHLGRPQPGRRRLGLSRHDLFLADPRLWGAVRAGLYGRRRGQFGGRLRLCHLDDAVLAGQRRAFRRTVLLPDCDSRLWRGAAGAAQRGAGRGRARQSRQDPPAGQCQP